MLSKEERRAAIEKCKEQKAPAGIYAVRCGKTGETWVGSSRNLNATKNGVWFSLRIGAHRDKSLQNAWDLHGEPAFSYDVLEKLDDDLSPLAVPDLLKAQKQHWLNTLSAHSLL